ncbi:MAG: hypothetical protein HZA52_15585 [Planctomycetes bacterium]|nr:hypothetical protein [Planctomycetota bacterium]
MKLVNHFTRRVLMGAQGRSATAWLAALTLSLAPTHVANAQSCGVTLQSIGLSGEGAAGPSDFPVVSGDGTVVCFSSGATDLIVGDATPPTEPDVYAWDLGSTTPELVSVSTAGVQASRSASAHWTSWNGDLVLIASEATNLVPGDTNGKADWFVRDRAAGTTTRVNLSETGLELNADTYAGKMTSDGRYFVFTTPATNVVAGDLNPKQDVFLRDLVTGVVAIVNIDTLGAQGTDSCGPGLVTEDGRLVVFDTLGNLAPCDTNLALPDVYVRDRVLGTTTCLSLDTSGVASGGSLNDISGDGRFVVWQTSAKNVVPGPWNVQVHVYLTDRLLGTTERVSVATTGIQANDDSSRGRVSLDGRFVTFESSASNLFPGIGIGWRVYLRDRVAKTTTLICQNDLGVSADGPSFRPAISDDGTVIAFQSDGKNLSAIPLHGLPNVFVRSCPPLGPALYCVAKDNSQGCLPSIAWQGTPRANAPSGFRIEATQVIGGRLGFLIYTTTSSTMLPFGGGYLCVGSPLRRVGAQLASGPPTGCDGAMVFDFNHFASSGVDPALVAGQQVWCQWWSRDGGFPPPNSLCLTAGLHFTLQ